MQLRDYQEEAVNIALNDGNQLIVAATGGGKTIIFANIVKELKGKKVLILAHRGELIQQAQDKLLRACRIKSTVFCASLGQKVISSVTVASIQSLAMYKKELPFDVVIVDECHNIKEKNKKSQYKTVLEKLNCKIIGVTATPYRLSQGLIYGKDKWFEEANFEINTQELIDMGFLVPFIHKVCKKLNLKGIKKTGGDYNKAAIETEMVKEIHLNAIKEDVEKWAQDRKSIVVFCTSIYHAEKVQEILGGEVVHSKLSKNERREALSRFDKGESRFMINVGVLTEGWDCPRVDCIVLARPTQSTGLYVQMVGRGLRLFEGKKDCLILDLANNGLEHGRVTNVNVHMIKLGDGEKKLEDKVCAECFELNSPLARECSNCGESLIEEVDVVEIEDKHEIVDLKAEYWKAYKGHAGYYTAASGNESVKVQISLIKDDKFKTVNHFYSLKFNHESKFRRIVKNNTKYNPEVMNNDIFIKGINAGKLFPIDKVEVYEKDGYPRIMGF